MFDIFLLFIFVSVGDKRRAAKRNKRAVSRMQQFIMENKVVHISHLQMSFYEYNVTKWYKDALFIHVRMCVYV